jgi:RNA polymerase sigma-70 factor (ECF subfamily)
MTWTTLSTVHQEDDRDLSFRTLYEEQAQALHTYAARLLNGDRQQAEDIVQETLLRCWKNRYSDQRSVRPWLYRVARNLIVDGYRSRQARPHEIDAGHWLQDLSGEGDDFDHLLSSVVVADAVRSLSLQHREALYETFFMGRTTSEAARALGVPQGTVKSRVHYALRSLRPVLEAQGMGRPAGHAEGSSRRLAHTRHTGPAALSTGPGRCRNGAASATRR